MNIRCPDCHTLFRLDARRVPADGADARCSRCGTVFPLGRAHAAAPDGNSPATAPEANAPAAAPEDRALAAVPEGSSPPVAPASQTPSPVPAAATSGEAGGVNMGPARTAPAGNGSPFSTEGDTRARRFARALVSDIVAYHPNLMAESTDPGAIQETFRDEIMKSWQEYVAQVGREAAEGTPYFREALNDLLADGRKVF